MRARGIGVTIMMLLTGVAAAAQPDEAARRVLSQLVAHDFAAVQAHLTPQMSAALARPEQLGQAWAHFAGGLGRFVRVDAAESQKAQGLDVTTLHCTFDMGRLDVRLAFDGEGRLAGLFFPPVVAWSPPSYARPERFDERDVTVGPLALPGKLTMPRGAGPFPAVVLVHGSGASDENETVGPIAPFHDLAVGLASRGVAVLRYQKRTFAHPEAFAPPARFTVREETIEDARAGVTLLLLTDKIDRRRLFVLGHSLGAMLAPRLAREDARVAGLLLLAGGTRPLEDIVVEQMKARGTPAEVAAAEASRRRIRDPKLVASDDVELLGKKVPASYFLDLRDYRPAQVAAELDLPILVLYGDRDIQVAHADFAGWQRALASRPRAQLRHYPTLTHLFVEGAGSLDDYAKPAHVAPVVIDDLVAFIAGKR